MIKFKASTPIAMDTICGSMVVVLENDPAKCDVLLSDIRKNLGLGGAVLIRGWTLQDVMKFNVQDIKRYRLPITQAVARQATIPN